jgi:plastocyanin
MMKGLAMKNRLLAAATVGLALAALPATALASDGIEVQDRCDEATFNAAGIDCHRPAGDGGGSVTLDALFASLAADRQNDKWRFKGDKVTLREGQPLNISMTRGGEAHTVTEVPVFGLGCVPPLNEVVFPGQDPTAFPPECANPATFTPGIFGGDLIVPGMTFTKVGLSKGTHRFQCMIHPWMKSTVTVR